MCIRDSFTYDGQPIYWNASIAETECSPYVYGYLYQELPDGSNAQMGYFYEHFTTECEDWGDVDLHVHNMTYTGTDTNNGTTDLIWNLSDLEVGQEYLFEWFTYRSSSYTASGEDSVYGEYYNSTTFTATSNHTHINWALETPGSWCDLDVNGYLYAEFDTSQEWWDEDQSDDVKWTSVQSSGHDLNPTCDGTEVAPYEPVSLLYLNESDEWVEVCLLYTSPSPRD